MTRAALLDVVRDRRPGSVSLRLPAGQTARFEVERVAEERDAARYATVKDAGDDPDVTDGATVWARVRVRSESDVDFRAGRGVGTVTLPGLPVEPGEPAINPVPRRMIREQVRTLLGDGGAVVEVGVLDGEQLAERTLNPRLGIEDGLSILGTTGIVVPYSNASYVASIEQGIDVARANGHSTLVLTTGGRTETYAMRDHDLPETAFVQFGTFLPDALDHLGKNPVEGLHLYMMPGKFSKLAQGHCRLHSDDVSTDMDRVHREILDLVGEREDVPRPRSVNQALSGLEHREKERLMQRWMHRAVRVLREREGPSPSRGGFTVTVVSLEGRTLARGRVDGSGVSSSP